MKTRKSMVFIITLLTVCLMLVGCVPISTSGGTTKSSETVSTGISYDKHYTYTCSTTSTVSALDYTSDALYKFFSEKYNIDVEVWPVPADGRDEKQRIWINSGTMPDFMSWATFNYQEYMEYANQGLLAPLPKGWEEKFPNLYDMFLKTNVYDYFEVNGSRYGIPHATFALFIDMDKVVNHTLLYYRKDWVEALGMEPFGPVITLSQLEAYIKGCLEKDLAGNGRTIGLASDNDNMVKFFTNFSGVDFDGFVEKNGKAVFGAQLDGVTDSIALGREWYKKGLIYPDFYMVNKTDQNNLFAAGMAAALFSDAPVTTYYNLLVSFADLNPDKDMSDVGVTIVADDKGVVYSLEATNFYSTTFFNPKLTDDQVLHIMDLSDYLCTKEGQYICQLGFEGVDWVEENGKIKVIRQPNEKGNIPSQYDMYPSYRVWRMQGVLTDSFNFASPAYPENVINDIKSIYEAKNKGHVIPFNFDYYLFSSDLKGQFSMDFTNEVIRLMISDGDIVAEWNKFIENNKNMWEPLLNELNTVLYK